MNKKKKSKTIIKIEDGVIKVVAETKCFRNAIIVIFLLMFFVWVLNRDGTDMEIVVGLIDLIKEFMS